jgi:hypothetical protein
MAVTKRQINEALKPLRGKTPDQIAELVKEKVGKAYCRNANSCAVAQFVANQLPQGHAVEVDGANVYVYTLDSTGQYAEWESEITVPLTNRIHEFIRRFDELEYPELVMTDEDGIVLRAEGDRLYDYTKHEYMRLPSADTSEGT